MKTHRILRGLKVLLFIVLAATVFSFAVLWLWNHLMPVILGFTPSPSGKHWASWR